MSTRTMRISVTLLIPAKDGLVWWAAEVEVPAEADDVAALDQINEILVEDGTLRCTRLTLGRDANGVRAITGRSPAIVGINGFATITPLHIVLGETE